MECDRKIRSSYTCLTENCAKQKWRKRRHCRPRTNSTTMRCVAGRTSLWSAREREREQRGAMQPGITVAIGGASWHGIAQAFKHDLHTEHDGWTSAVVHTQKSIHPSYSGGGGGGGFVVEKTSTVHSKCTSAKVFAPSCLFLSIVVRSIRYDTIRHEMLF